MRHRSLFIGFLATLAVGAGVTAPAGAGTNPFGTKSPAQILSLVSSAMEKTGSVRLLGTVSFPGLIQASATLDSAVGKSTQSETGNGAIETDRLIGTTLFIMGNTVDYESSYGLKNSPLANKWVLVPSSNPNYAEISSGEKLFSLAKATLQMGSLKNLGVSTFRGQRAVAISGKLPSTASFPNAPQTIYVSTSSPFLPVGYMIKLTESGHRGRATALFSKWGESVNVPEPPTYVTATSKDFP
jgi:hypothetical protein